MSTAKELQELSADELSTRAANLRDELFKDELKLRTGTLNSPSERSGKRRDLARILTVLSSKLKASKKA